MAAVTPHKLPSSERKSSKGSITSKRSANGRSADVQSRHTSVASGAKRERNKKQGWFSLFAQKTALLAGRPTAFILATITILVWAVTGPMFGYSDTWQLVINTGTTIVTFLMVFLIQNSQNRDSLAFQLKLDELIIAMQGAENRMAGAEDLCDEDLAALHEDYRRRAKEVEDELQDRRRND